MSHLRAFATPSKQGVFLLWLVLFICYSFSVHGITETGLVAFYKLNNITSGYVIDEASGKNLTLYGAVLPTLVNYSGAMGLNFTNAGYLNSSEVVWNLAPDYYFSFETRVALINYSGSHTLAQWKATANYAGEHALIFENGYTMVLLRDYTAPLTTMKRFRYVNNTPSAFHHIVVTWNGTNNQLTFYLDGQMKNVDIIDQNNSVAITNAVKVLTFGADATALTTTNLNGFVDYLKFYNKTLSPSEVLAHAAYGENYGNETITYFLIDERTGAAFDVLNLTSARLISEDGVYNYSLDIRTGNLSSQTILFNTSARLRFEFEYPTAEIITRYFDMSLVPDKNNLRVCVNKYGIVHYQQLIQSGRIRATALKNQIYNCYVGYDYTRFSYQQGYMLPVQTIDALYYLYTSENGVPSYLASVAGAIQTYYILDAIELGARGYNIQIDRSNLGFSRIANDTLRIEYMNDRGDSQSTAVLIKRMNTSATVLNIVNTTNANHFFIYFNYSTLNVSASEIFKVTVTSTLTDGTTTEDIRYFSGTGSAGSFDPRVAFAIALILLLVAITTLPATFSFSWFGVILEICAIGIISFAPLTWYTSVLLAISLIIAIFTTILMFSRNSATVV